MDAIIFIGAPASGKSSFYMERFADTHVRLNLDMLCTRHRENAFLDTCLNTGMSFVVDNTNPGREDRKRYIKPAQEKNARIIGYYFKSEIMACLKRNQGRIGDRRIPDSAVKVIHGRLELPSLAEGFHELYYVHLQDGEFMVEAWEEERNEPI